MINKENWEETKKRYITFWDGGELDSPIVQITSPKKGVKYTSSYDGWTLMRKRDNLAEAIREFEEHCNQIYFGADSFPHIWMNFGPGFMATYVGAEPKFAPDTVWFETPKEWDELKDIRFEPNNKWWKLTKDSAELSSKAGRGKWITGMTDIGGPLDVAASLRGTQALLFDLVENPDRVKALTKKINDLWIRYYNEIYDITKKNGQEGAAAWMGLWSSGSWYPLQCDFSAMISPEMFEEFVLPDLQQQCKYLDRTIYHWDGPGQIPHLEMLLDIPELTGIQWVPGSGQPPCESPKWFPLYKRIQEKGKRLCLCWIPPDKIEGLLKEVSPKGLFLTTGASSEEEANDLMKKIKKWSIR